MPKYYNNTCEYVFKNGSKKGESCGKNCQENLCKTHKKNTLDKKKEYYNKNKQINNGPYDHLIERAKKNIRIGNNVDIFYYVEKKNKIENELYIFKLKRNGILLALDKITENELILNDKLTMTFMIRLLKYHYKYKDIILKKRKNKKKIDDIELKIEKLNDKEIIKELKNKIEKLNEDEEDEEDKYNEIQYLKEIKITEEDLKNEKLKQKAINEYNEQDKYFSYISYFANDQNGQYYNDMINMQIYIPIKNAKDKDLKNIEEKILHNERLILTYTEIIKLINIES